MGIAPLLGAEILKNRYSDRNTSFFHRYHIHNKSQSKINVYAHIKSKAVQNVSLSLVLLGYLEDKEHKQKIYQKIYKKRIYSTSFIVILGTICNCKGYIERYMPCFHRYYALQLLKFYF